MIEINGTTFTSGPGEADKIFVRLKNAGHTHPPLPLCDFGQEEGCGRFTGYIVEECYVVNPLDEKDPFIAECERLSAKIKGLKKEIEALEEDQPPDIQTELARLDEEIVEVGAKLKVADKERMRFHQDRKKKVAAIRKLHPDLKINKKRIIPKRSGVLMLMAAIRPIDYVYNEEKLYFRIPMCHRCGASREGWLAGFYRPKDRNKELARLEKQALLPEEIAEAKKIYDRAFDKGVQKLQEKASNKRTSKGRYKEK